MMNMTMACCLLLSLVVSFSSKIEAASATNQSGPYRDASTLRRAPHYWSDAAITKLLESGSNVNVRGGKVGQTPLLFAAVTGRHQYIKPLLDAGADPYARDYLGRDAFDEMSHLWYKGYMRALQQFVDHVREPQNLEVIEFMQSGDEQRFARWLASNPDLEIFWDLERTPLLWALYYDRRHFAAELAARGARLDVVDYRGYTPLHFAAMNGNLQFARALHATGAWLDSTNDYGQTPLALSLLAPDLQVMAYLLASGADPCIGPQNKSDVLDLARSSTNGNEPEAIQLLLPEVEMRSCKRSSKEARRANASEFTRRLKALSPPPDYVLTPTSHLQPMFNDIDTLREVALRFRSEQMSANSAQTYRDITRSVRTMGYRSVLAHPDDENFGFHGTSIWMPKLDPENMEIELAINQLRLEHFSYFKNDRDTAVLTCSHSKNLARAGRLLEAVDVSEKFLRERINDIQDKAFSHYVFKELVKPLWLLGRQAEAFEVGDAELMRGYGTAEGKARKNHLGWVLDHMLEVSDKPELLTRQSSHATAANLGNQTRQFLDSGVAASGESPTKLTVTDSANDGAMSVLNGINAAPASEANPTMFGPPPDPKPIPTLSNWGVVFLILLFIMIAMRHRTQGLN